MCKSKNQSTIALIVCGATGRMGQRLCALAMIDDEVSLIGAIEHGASTRLNTPSAPGGPAVKTRDSAAFARGSAHIVIDFSNDQGARDAADLAVHIGAALLVGTTALGEQTMRSLRQASSSIPVLVAPNTSLGVGVVADLARRAAAALPGFECSIIESHHSKKKDAPSGTALRLAAAVRSGGNDIPPQAIVAIRGGDVIGEHTIRFAGAGEYVEITHRATSRDLFALGALRAAKWLRGRVPAWYTMDDVLAMGA